MGSFVFGLLGARADATFGRLHLRPQIPGEWESLRVRNLRVGDAKVNLAYQAGETGYRYLLWQTAGRTPLTLTLEPLIPGGPVTRVLLGGEEIEVDSFQLGMRKGPRLSLALDQEREIVLVPG